MIRKGREEGVIAHKGVHTDAIGRPLNLRIRKAFAHLDAAMQVTKQLFGKWIVPIPGGSMELSIIKNGAVPIRIAKVVGGEIVGLLGPVAQNGFIFWPVSDSAVYGWGIPYEDAGGPINPPLGTVLTSAASNDATYRQYRLVELQDGQFVVVHNQPYLGGHRWKLTKGRLLSWRPPAGWEAWAPVGHATYPVFYDGNYLTGHTNEILAVSWRSIGEIDYIYVLLRAGDTTIRAARQEINWDTLVVGVWETSNTVSVSGQVQFLFDRGSAAINGSCTEATVVTTLRAISTPPRLTVYEDRIDLSGWPSISISAVNHSIDSETYSEGASGTSGGSSTPLPFIPTDENWTSCFIAPPLPPTGGSTTFYDQRENASVTATLSVEYNEDILIRDTVDVLVEGAHTSNVVDAYGWTEDPLSPGFWFHTSLSLSDTKTSDESITITFKRNGAILDSKPLWKRAYSYSDSWSGSWGVAEDPHDITPSGSYSGSNERIRYGVTSPQRTHYPSVGANDFFIQYGQSYYLLSVSTGGPAYVENAVIPDCIAAYLNEQNTDTEVTDQTINTILKGNAGSYTYNHSVTVPISATPAIPTDGWIFSTFSSSASLRNILAEVCGDFYGHQSNLRFDVIQGPNRHVMAQLWPNDAGAITFTPALVFSGGDLVALTQMQGANPQTRYNSSVRQTFGVI